MASLTQVSVFVKLTLLIGIVPMAMGLAYAFRPSERRLAMMRPLSLAAIFASLCALLLGFIGVFAGIAASGATISWQSATAGFAEALVAPFVTFAFLTVAWIGVAFGIRRQV